MALGFVRMTNSSTVEELHKYLSSFGMDTINYFLPTLHLILVEEAGCSKRASSFDRPGSPLGDYEGSPDSLSIVLNKHISGDAILGVTPFPGKRSHNDSVLKGEVTHLHLVTPVG